MKYSWAICAIATILCQVAVAQNFERYRPQTVEPAPLPPAPDLRGIPDPASGSDRELLDQLEAIIVFDDASAVDPKATNEDEVGLVNRLSRPNQIVNSPEFAGLANQYIGQPVSLRSLNQLARDIVMLFRRMKRPVIDVQIPEQEITGGTIQLVIIESRVGRVMVSGGDFFDPCMLTRWIECTRSGGVIYEPWIENDLFWLNQNAFRRVGVDLRPGASEGTTDVVFEVDDVAPVRGYFGYDDTGVQTLGRERLLAGFIYGNVFGGDGSLSYQYTTDGDFNRLHAHALTYNQPIDRDWSYLAYGSWASTDPTLLGGLLQGGESWQIGTELRRTLEKDRWGESSLAVGVDFKTTNNNLEFGGINVQNSDADLLQLRMNYERITRDQCDQYSLLRAGVFVGPGGGLTSSSDSDSFQTIRPGTSPDYIYARLSYEEALNIGPAENWQLVTRAVGQVASERLLFSETLGLGGYDTIRGYDQRSLNADHGWQLNFELGPRPIKFCCRGEQEGRLRPYAFVDLGDSYIQNPLPGENGQEFVSSVGVGARLSIGQDVSLRIDYGHGFADLPGVTNDRLHLGLIWLFGPRP